LLAAGVIERLPQPDEQRRTVRLTTDLPVNFALNQPLSTFALAALDLLDPAGDTYPLDVVSVYEATLDDPRQVLAAQQNNARGEAVAAMKADGLDYDQRMELLGEVTYPKPLGELLSGAFGIYRQSHPWLSEDDLSPKSVVRDMWERAMTFTEYVAFYGLSRSEGTLLRYLTDAYRALRASIPDTARTDALTDIVEWLGALVRQVDSSLLDEWEQLAGGVRAEDVAVRPQEPVSLTDNVRAFTVLVRNAMFRRVELAALRRVDALGGLDGEGGWDAPRWAAALDDYFAEYDRIETGPDARNPALLHIDTSAAHIGRVWRVRQVFDDPDGDRDWGITADIDLVASDDTGEPAVTVTGVGPL
jgi:hypothetical protein